MPGWMDCQMDGWMDGPFAKLKPAADGGNRWMATIMMMPSQTQSGKSISFHFDCVCKSWLGEFWPEREGRIGQM